MTEPAGMRTIAGHRVIGVAGFKNAGKTTLVEKLVMALTARGYRVSTVKHAHHSFDIDHEGRDSFRHRHAGATEVVVTSQSRWAIIHELRGAGEPPLSEIVAKLAPCDLVIVEGYKRDGHDKIEVRNLGLAHPPLAGGDPTVVAIAANGAIANAPVPAFDRDDVAALLQFIERHAGLSPSPVAVTPEAVIAFWDQAGPGLWFEKHAAFDAEIAARFGAAVAAARSGQFDHWAQTPQGAVALALLLDQMPRNIHRGSPLAFAADPQALQLARAAVARGDLDALSPDHAQWLVMPFEHAEDMAAQQQAVELFQALGLSDMVKWAELHRDIIRRFGRFPHRNAILGRPSTPDELSFLASGGFAG